MILSRDGALAKWSEHLLYHSDLMFPLEKFRTQNTPIENLPLQEDNV